MSVLGMDIGVGGGLKQELLKRIIDSDILLILHM